MRFVKGAVLVLAGALAGGAIAWAHGGDTTRVHSCTTGEGQPILLSSPNGTCPAGAQPLDWAIQGPAGPRGPVGPRGPAGTAAKASPPPAMTAIRQSKAGSTQEGALVTMAVLCPKGSFASGGGYRVIGDVRHPRILRNTAITSGTHSIGWSVWGEAGKKQDAWTVEVTVVCVKP
jgi:hypothetical protein